MGGLRANKALMNGVIERLNDVFAGCDFRLIDWGPDYGLRIGLNCGSMIEISTCIIEHHPDIIPAGWFLEPVNDEVAGVYPL